MTISDLSRPRLRPDVTWRSISDGVLLQSGVESLRLNGASAGPLLDRLAPFLTGAKTLGDITAGLAVHQREAINTLVSALTVRGYVRDDAAVEPTTLSEEERRIFAKEIAYLDYFVPSAAARFERFRRAEIRCVGNGAIIKALMEVLPRMGAAGVQLGNAYPEHSDAEATVKDVFAVVVARSVKDAREQLQELGSPALVVAAVPLTDKHFLLGPIGARHAAEALACIEGAQEPVSAENPWVTGPVPQLMACRLALMLLRAAAGVETDNDREDVLFSQLNVQDLSSTDCHYYPLRPQSGQPLSHQDLTENLKRAVDPVFGIIHRISEDSVRQVPVATAYSSFAIDGVEVRRLGWGRTLDSALLDAGVAAVQARARAFASGGDALPEMDTDGLLLGRSSPLPSGTAVALGSGPSLTAAIVDGLAGLLVQCIPEDEWLSAPWLEGFGGVGSGLTAEANAEVDELLETAAACGVPLTVGRHELLPGFDVFKIAGTHMTRAHGTRLLGDLRRIVATAADGPAAVGNRVESGLWPDEAQSPVTSGELGRQLRSRGIEPRIRLAAAEPAIAAVLPSMVWVSDV